MCPDPEPVAHAQPATVAADTTAHTDIRVLQKEKAVPLLSTLHEVRTHSRRSPNSLDALMSTPAR